MIILYAILGLIVLLLAVMTVRALRFKPEPIQNTEPIKVSVDTEAAIKHLSEAIQFKTISRPDPNDVEWEEFDKFAEYLKVTYPTVTEKLTREVVADHSLLYHWKGTGDDKPLALLSHMDVVPVMPGTEDDWDHDAFSGHVDDTYIWGRGTVDMKNQLIAVMEAIETLLKEGFTPSRDIYLCFGHNEEVVGSTGGGAQAIAELLKSRGVELGCVLDEGGAIHPGSMFNIDGNIGVVGIGEKGYADIKMTVKTTGGHASQPPRNSGLVQVCDAVCKLEKNLFKPRMTRTIRDMLETLGPHMGFGMRLMLANLWITSPLIKMVFTKKTTTNAMVRTTTAPTMAEGSPAGNVLPQTANVSVNYRVLQGEPIEDVMDHIRKVTKNDKIELELLRGKEPSGISPLKTPEFDLVKKTIQQIYGAIPVSPYLMLGGTDSCFFEIITDKIYCIMPFELSNEDLKGMHGTNEKIQKHKMEKGVAFFITFVKGYCG